MRVPRPTLVLKLAIAVAGVFACLYLLGRGVPKVYAGGVVVATVAAFMALNWYDHRRRRVRVSRRMAELGFTLDPLGPFEHELHYTPAGNHHSLAVPLFGRAEWSGRRVRLAEYRFETGSGSHNWTHRFLQVAVECPGEWPEFALAAPLHFGSRPLLSMFTRPGEVVGDRAFDQRWQLESADRDGALGVLGPAVREWLAKAPARERWVSQGGWLSCTWSGAPNESTVDRILSRPAMFLSLVRAPEPEVAA